jgi:FKBP-type peptidyl-prolyl cis-trans isomerase
MNKYFIVAIAIVLIGALIFYSSKKSGPKDTLIPSSPTPTTAISPTLTQEKDVTISPMNDAVNELVVEDLKVGTGAEAVAGKKVTVNYKGTLTSGVQFDSSYDRGIPFDFVLGAGGVIQGWDEGVAGMKVGGKRKLTIPASLGYGARAVGSIPANSTLIFEVELLKVE